MDIKLNNLLRNYSAEDGSVPTHVSMYGPKKEWSIKDNAYTSFWIDYCKLVSETKSENLCLAEYPKTHMPVMMDLTLKFHPLEKNVNTYDYDFLVAVVYCLQQSILEVFEISETQSELICCVLECDDYMENNMVVSKFRLQFPYCKTLASIQMRRLRPTFIKMLRTENVISRLSHQPINNWENIVDPLTPEQPCIMYGSSVLENVPKYVLEHIFHKIEYENIDDGNAKVLELEDVFIFTNHETVLNGIVQSNIFNEYQDYDFWLPMFLSVSYYNMIVKPIKNDSKVDASIKEISSSSSNTKGSTKSDDNDDLDAMAECLLSMIDVSRSKHEHYLIDIGKALYNIYQGNERGLFLWLEFTRHTSTKDQEEYESMYSTFYGSPITIKTLAWYAKIDSPKEYERWHKSWYGPYLAKATTCTHADVALALYRVYWLEFAAGSLNKKSLYHFKNHIWDGRTGELTLRKYINADFIPRFEKLRSDVSIKIHNSNDSSFKESSEVLIRKIGNLILKLKNRTFKNKVIEEAIEHFHVVKLTSLMDQNIDLFAMQNCIIECTDDKAVPRDGKPEDYMSKTSGVRWNGDYHWKHPTVLRLMDWLQKIFPDKELMNYHGKLCGSFLKGGNSDKIFPVYTGQGDNSKSMLKKLYDAAFGSYSVTIPTEVLTARKNNSGPTPETAHAVGSRILFASEPSADVNLKDGPLKLLTGGDKFFTRKCGQDGGEMDITFVLILMCNEVPIVPNSCKAVKNRIRIVPFLSTWVRNAPKSRDEQFKQRRFQMDKFFERKIPGLASAFIWYCVQMYELYMKEGLIEPKIVTQHTQDYWNENDVYIQFIKERLTKAYKDTGSNEQIIDEDAKISISDMYSTFTDWLREYFPNIPCPNRKNVVNELSQRLGKTFKRSWRGIKFNIPIADI